MTYPELYVVGYNERHDRIIMSSRTSLDLHADNLLIDKALMFRDASLRDGRLFVCTLVPRWKRVFLKLLRIQYSDKRHGR
jgi:hypothetical protein